MRGDLPQGDEQPDIGGPSPSHRGPPGGRSGGPSARTLLIAAVLMVAAGYYLSVKLRDMGRMQDCLMSGRTNCAPISGADK